MLLFVPVGDVVASAVASVVVVVDVVFCPDQVAFNSLIGFLLVLNGRKC